MADIFDTSLSEGRSVQQSINEPFINPQSRAAGAEVSASDQYNLAAGQRVDQMEAQHRAELAQIKAARAARAAQKAKLEGDAAAARNLDNLTSGLINRYNDLDTKVTNPIERNRLKREADLIAMQAAGKGNQDYINGFIGKLNTKMEAREDGLVNVLDSQGNIIRIEAGDKDAVLNGRMSSYRQTVDEVLPNTLDSMDMILRKDSVTGGHIKEGTVTNMLTTFKNESGRMKRVSDEFHVQANMFPSSEMPKLKEKALSGYLSATANMFGAFTSPDVLSAIRAGGITGSDVEIAMQQMRRDIMDDISMNKVPVKPADVEAFMKTSMDNIRDVYKSIQKNDMLPLENAAIQAELKNKLAKEEYKMKMGVPKLEVDKQISDFYVSNAAAITGLYEAAGFNAASPEQAAMLKEQASQLIGVAGDTMAIHTDVKRGFSQGTLHIEDFSKYVGRMNTKEDAIDAFGVLARATKTRSGVMLAPQVIDVMEKAAPKISEMINKGELEWAEVNSIMQQLKQYESAYRDVVKKSGFTPEEYLARSQMAYTAPGSPGAGSMITASGKSVKDVMAAVLKGVKEMPGVPKGEEPPKPRSKERSRSKKE